MGKAFFNLDYWRGLAAGMMIMYFWMRRKPASVDMAFCPVSGDDAVTQVLRTIRQQCNIPAMAAAVVTSNGINLAGAVGVRKRGTEIPVEIGDKWHLGSDTKAMTSTLIAGLIERGRLEWSTTLGEIFPDLSADMHPEYRSVTISHLLSHRAGLRPNLDIVEFGGDDGPALRLCALRKELGSSPGYPPGTRYLYSNLGYVIAGAVVERAAGISWEEAIQLSVFRPLGMSSAGFGGTGTPGEVDQPWPHLPNGNPAPTNGVKMDNPPVMMPAGGVHCAIQDWAKFVQDQLRGALGESGLLKPETYQILQTPPLGGEYALGWIVVRRGWAGGIALNHGGSNTMNYANVWIAPARDVAILVCANQGGKMAFKATDDTVVALMKLAGSIASHKLRN